MELEINLTPQRLTIVPDDNLVVVDDSFIRFNLKPFNLPKALHAVQWLNGRGHVEWKNGTRNQTLKHLTTYHPIIKSHAQEKAKQAAAKIKNLEQQWQDIRMERDSKIRQLAFEPLRYQREKRKGLPTTRTPQQLRELDDYVISLCNVPSNYDHPSKIVWPKPPEFVKIY